MIYDGIGNKGLFYVALPALLLLAPRPDDIDLSPSPLPPLFSLFVYGYLILLELSFEYEKTLAFSNFTNFPGDAALIYRFPRMLGCEPLSETFEGVFSA